MNHSRTVTATLLKGLVVIESRSFLFLLGCVFGQHILLEVRVGKEVLVNLKSRFRLLQILLLEASFLQQLKKLLGTIFD